MDASSFSFFLFRGLYTNDFLRCLVVWYAGWIDVEYDAPIFKWELFIVLLVYVFRRLKL